MLATFQTAASWCHNYTGESEVEKKKLSYSIGGLLNDNPSQFPFVPPLRQLGQLHKRLRAMLTTQLTHQKLPATRIWHT
jgi:hypothetical protein